MAPTKSAVNRSPAEEDIRSVNRGGHSVCKNNNKMPALRGNTQFLKEEAT